MIKIDSDIPVPDDLRYRGGNSKYPWVFMKVGDSFFVEITNGKPPTVATSAAQWIRRNSKSWGSKPPRFTTRKVTENGIDGVRIWRIA